MLCGIRGKPYLDLEPFLDEAIVAALPDVEREVSAGLVHAEARYTGGTLKWMGVCAPWTQDDGYLDAMHAIERFSLEEWKELVALADDPSSFDASCWRDTRFGDETEHPFSRAQERFLEVKHGVYFPWKCCVHLLENDRWEDKHHGAGKDFSAEARKLFPRTVELVKELPFEQVGRVVIFGLMPNDHAPAHRDTEPGKSELVAQSISLCPRRDKRFYLTDGKDAARVIPETRAYWFNDMDWHGVEAQPFFRWSMRVDGVFTRDFAKKLSRG